MTAGDDGMAPDEDTELRFRAETPKVHGSAEVKQSTLGRYCEVGPRCVLREVALGDFSYVERGGEAIYATIGRFVSIAANARINALEHPMERVTTHKISYRPNEYFRFLPVDTDFRARRRAAHVTIGHDVWIGHGAVILPGVTVGHGAVIGANAVIRQDVAPYMIVAGVPGRTLRPRFPQHVVDRLLALQWWDWPLETLYSSIPDMQSLPIEAFLDRWEAGARSGAGSGAG